VAVCAGTAFGLDPYAQGKRDFIDSMWFNLITLSGARAKLSQADVQTARAGGTLGMDLRTSALFIVTKDPAKRKAAWEFVQFSTGPEAYTSITSKIGYLPLRTALAEPFPCCRSSGSAP
jgi:ABC-type glycerol-3-phosphate transport system substrate-binding protein